MIYRLILSLRHRAYDSGFLKSQEPAAVRTIGIGNVTVGGTGKTPHVEYVVKRLLDRYDPCQVAVLSRGYGRRTKGYLEVEAGGSASEYGDEPLQIKNRFPSVRVAVCKDRLEGCRRLSEQGVEVVVLDDSMQYRRLKPTVSMCLMDYSRPAFADRLLPFGRLRDLPSRAHDAGLVVVTKCPEGFDAQPFAERYCRVAFSRIVYGALEPAFGGTARESDKLIVLTGIANNRPLLEHLASGHKIVKVLEFPDHHAFRPSDIRTLRKALREHPGASVVTTRKDMSRLYGLKSELGTLADSLFVAPISVEFCTDADKAAFEALLVRIF